MHYAKEKNSGFTLIELVSVIVIVAILSVVAAPKFLSLSSEANRATIEGAYGGIKDAMQLAHSKSLIDDSESRPISVVYYGDENVQMVYGYPAADHNGIISASVFSDIAYYGASQNNSEHDWVTHLWNEIIPNVGSAPAIALSLGKLVGDAGSITTPKNTKCYVYYIQATDKSEPQVTIDTSGC